MFYYASHFIAEAVILMRMLIANTCRILLFCPVTVMHIVVKTVFHLVIISS